MMFLTWLILISILDPHTVGRDSVGVNKMDQPLPAWVPPWSKATSTYADRAKSAVSHFRAVKIYEK